MLSASEEILPRDGTDGTTWQFRLAAITVNMIAYYSLEDEHIARLLPLVFEQAERQ